MEIKNLKVINKNNIIAVFDVRFNSELEIFGFKLATGKNGEFVAMKSIKNWKDVYEPIGTLGKNTSDSILAMVKEQMGVEPFGE